MSAGALTNEDILARRYVEGRDAKPLTRARVFELLRYNVISGELTWRFNYQRPDLIGQRAGGLNQGYWRIAIDGVQYYCANVIWLMIYGVLPSSTVDHIDLNKANDCLFNLRLATKGQNAANSKMNDRNTSGYKGVSFCKTTSRWRASIQINGYSKNLGRHDTPEEAHKAWLIAAQEAHGSEFVRAS